jgi:hypothetical protein
MRRITLWITATVAVAALLGAYQANATGTTGKGGEEGDHGVTTGQTDGTAGEHAPKAGETK